MQNIPALDPMDKNYQRVKYVRYADDFVVCIIGSKKTANEIKERIAGFMQKELHLELSREKTKIAICRINECVFWDTKLQNLKRTQSKWLIQSVERNAL